MYMLLEGLICELFKTTLLSVQALLATPQPDDPQDAVSSITGLCFANAFH